MKTLLKSLTLLFLCGLFCAPATAPGAEKKNVTNVIRSFYKTNNMVGLSVTIRTSRRTVTYKHGYANLEYRAAITDGTVFRIASVSKLFTTMGILKLKEQGLLSLDDTLSKYVTNFPHGDAITIRNLLQHTSGIPNFLGFNAVSNNPAKDWTSGELVQLMREYLQDHDLDFEPGTTADYSNSNFTLLGVIIETVTGKSFSDYMAQEVVAPLKMKNTAVGSDSAIIRHRAAGYEVENGMVQNASYFSIIAPFATGDFLSQPMELAKITDTFKPGRFLTQPTITEMVTPVVLNNGTTWTQHSAAWDVSFGYCWELIKPTGKTEWIPTKSGAIPGFFAYVLYFPSADVSITIDSNCQGNFSLLDLGLGIGDAMGIIK
jgi:CubicO group peptidase (beta-lactamase class C family)